MASSGSYTTNSIVSSRTLTFSWSIAGQSISGNYSDIGWTLRGSGGDTFSWVLGQNFRQYVDGNTYTSNANRQVYNGTVIMSGTTRVYHNSDGNKTLNANTIAQMYQYTDNTTGSGSWSLTQIPRASTISTSVSQANIGSNVNLTIGALNVSTYTLKLFYSLNGASEVQVGNVSSGTYAFTLPNSLLNSLPSSLNGTLSIILKTYNGNTLIGQNSVSIKAVVPDNIKPTVSLALSEVGSVPASWGCWVQGQSRVKGTITATPGTGSSLASSPYYSTINNNKYYTNPFTATGVLTNSGTTVVTSQVTDLRGRSNSVSNSISVVAYSTPSINSPKIVRCNSDGTENANGTCAKVTIPFVISPVNNKNTRLIIVKWKLKESSSYSNSKAITPTQYSATETLVINDFEFLVSKIYDFEITVNDYFTNTKQYPVLGTVAKIQSIRPKGEGMAFNKYATEDGVFEIEDWKLKANAGAEITGTTVSDKFVLSNGNVVLGFVKVDEW